MTMLTPDFSSRPETPASNEVSDPITELLRGHARGVRQAGGRPKVTNRTGRSI